MAKTKLRKPIVSQVTITAFKDGEFTVSRGFGPKHAIDLLIDAIKVVMEEDKEDAIANHSQ